MLSLAVGVAALVSPALALTPLETFYPPTLNDTAYISNASIGTYGGVYTAQTRTSVYNASYGVYDYCTMPHPRTQEYQMPAAIANGNVTGKLTFLEYVQRHQRRTPYNIFPYGEATPYECDNVLPYLYAAPQSGVAPVPVYGKTYTDPTNPFVASYIPGTCQYPQLTVGGVLDGVQHGKDLWAVYGEKLGLIPKTPDSSIWLRSSESPLTQQSAGGVLRGIWANYTGSLPLMQQTTSVDTVNAGFSCSAKSALLSAIESTDLWNEHLTVTAPLLQALGDITGANTSAWTSTFDHFSDNFQGRLCNGYALPCSETDSTSCVTMAQAEEVFRAGDWEWNYWWRNNANVTEYIQMVEGPFIGEILAHFEAVLAGNSTLKYSHDFVHDGDVGPILGALGITQLRWPAMGSNVAFEIWETNDATNKFYARVLLSGQPVETIHGVLDWLPLTSLISILKPFVPSDIVALCNS
ncbi:histidine acid phosphatase [Coleophoma crateriformis]|uniref:Histidine acid phosphatase n=1 Tax=Coleophoma crateriformis TaxID=565419 RepID=A0A3D8QIW8_9HELO|nr:histidine acid phosphatase [Coleophoma crateriformis]